MNLKQHFLSSLRRRGLIALALAVGLAGQFGLGAAGFSELNPTAAVWDSPAQEDAGSIRNWTGKFQRGMNHRSLGSLPSVANTTPGQFTGFVAYGAVVRPPGWSTNAQASSLGNGYAADIGLLNLPRNSAGAVSIVLRSAVVGAPTFSRLVTLNFGAVIQPPLEELAPSTKRMTLAEALQYWNPEPHNSSSTDFYYSAHARRVYATKSGPVKVRWRRADGIVYNAQTPPAGTAGVDYIVESGFYYELKEVDYVVSGNAVKQPQRIFWTEGDYRGSGVPVDVPAGAVRDVKIVYNTSVPEWHGVPNTTNQNVTARLTDSGVPEDNPVNRSEWGTIWYDSGQDKILANRVEGRVFVELLGESIGDQRQRHLGVELVDIRREAIPESAAAWLGEELVWAGAPSGETVYPQAVRANNPFIYQEVLGSGELSRYFAVKETVNTNDVQLHWLRSGVQGLRWPSAVVRYWQRWPTDLTDYVHYLRPPAADHEAAKQTAVQLPGALTPIVAYQDDESRTGPKSQSDLFGASRFYTFLAPGDNLHRTLLRYNAEAGVAFERVYAFASGTVRGSGSGTFDKEYNGAGHGNTGSARTLPRHVGEVAYVGRRIKAPSGELGAAGAQYLPGYIAAGTSYHPGAYLNPYEKGFVDANGTATGGAIIPVNAIPEQDTLEVHWFREGPPNAVNNATVGTHKIYWPAVIGTYTLRWPHEEPGYTDLSTNNAIVLASNDGSGELNSLQAKGTIYTQNNPQQPGYNPNEEHALMTGGQAYALRDDLNLTKSRNRGLGDTNTAVAYSGGYFSSEPYVLLDYTDEDGRPNLQAFRVLRELGDLRFDYQTLAGTQLQAPMPLPLLPPPVDDAGVNHNALPSSAWSPPAGWRLSHYHKYPAYASYVHRDRKQTYWVVRGAHHHRKELRAGTYNEAEAKWYATTTNTAVVGSAFTNVIHTSHAKSALTVTSLNTLPAGLSLNGFAISGTPTASAVAKDYDFLITNTNSPDESVTNTLRLTVLATGSATTPTTNAPLKETFTMQFAYKTQPGFAFPGLKAPKVSAVVPYLRKEDGQGGYLGAATNAAEAGESRPALEVTYRPAWPADAPMLQFGRTLTTASDSLPAIRGQKSVQLLYQQSIARKFSAHVGGTDQASAVLFDPTRAKTRWLTTNGEDGKMADVGKDLLKSINTELYQGKFYFPNLPPHLERRVFFDPNAGTNGLLVLQGQFVDAALGEDYLRLNVLRGAELRQVQALHPAEPTDKKDAWDQAVTDLSFPMELFVEDLAKPGTYVARTNPAPSLVSVGDIAAIDDDDIAVDSYALSAAGPGSGYVTLIFGNGEAFTPSGDPVSVKVVYVDGESMYPGELKVVAADNPLSEQTTFEHSVDLAGRFADYDYEWKMNPPVDGQEPPLDATMSQYQPLTNGFSIPIYVLGGSGIQALVDNWIVMRYRPKAGGSHPLAGKWSEWSKPAFAEGWIKRVLDGVNPFNQRVTDLNSHGVNTDANILTSAGRRWEGDIALTQDSLNDHGLIEIYETVLRHGRNLSIDAGINFGPANDALLLAAGYINDLYMMIGNEARADAANPTIGIGTKDGTYGDIATALFAFKGQLPTLLEEELGLLRGRDDVLQPGVEVKPVYNRLFWNYTRGIDSGEVIYAMNYNILDQNNDARVDAADAAVLYPQGHGDAYGHYLTAVKGYYSLLLNPKFAWVPRVEAVTILGKPVTVDYTDERKFAAAAAAVARTGLQVTELTWRKDYQHGRASGWGHLSTRRESRRQSVAGTSTNAIVREWGADQWASRTMQGAFYHWVAGNSMLPETDPDPTHEGIQKVDRTTVPELQELTATAEELRTVMDNAEGHLTPLGLAAGSLAFDLDPDVVVGQGNRTHFEQVYDRAKVALNNAMVSFDDAKDVTRLMRGEQDSLEDYQTEIDLQEQAYTNALIEIYGTPYAGDIGPGKTYKQGYAGPDLMHYRYVDKTETAFPNTWSYTKETDIKVEIWDVPPEWGVEEFAEEDFKAFRSTNNLVGANAATVIAPGNAANSPLSWTQFEWNPSRPSNNLTNLAKQFVRVARLEFNIGGHGFAEKPGTLTGKRRSPGELQAAISAVILAHARLQQAVNDAAGARNDFVRQMQIWEANFSTWETLRNEDRAHRIAEQALEAAQHALDMFVAISDQSVESIERSIGPAIKAIPRSFVVGLASGGDLTAPARALIEVGGNTRNEVVDWLKISEVGEFGDYELSVNAAHRWREFDTIIPLERDMELRQIYYDLTQQVGDSHLHLWQINERARELDDARNRVRALEAKGDRLQLEREIFRKRAAAIVQGYRTRDAAFRIFRNEKLERYKSLFDLAARYAYLAANAYDYETGLLGTPEGKAFVQRIVNSRALGVMADGEPLYAGSNTGDPGLSSVLAEMKADWDVLKGRLGFNNADGYGTTVSLRYEKHRFLPGTTGRQAWQDLLANSRKANILDDADVLRHCQQVNPGDGLPLPGIILEFSTTVQPGFNLFGRPLAAGDHAFHRSAFATKIHAVGVAMEGYRGMSDPAANAAVIGGASPNDPDTWYTDPNGLAATPYVYLIPVGVDTMRSPPLGDTSTLRSWTVNDVAIPLPFNVGASGHSTEALYQRADSFSADSLSEPMFSLRKHQAFRPVASSAVFPTQIYNTGLLENSQYTNRRLIGRSVWNSKWKLVIPGDSLLHDPKEGLDRFIRTVNDIKLHFVTYSYSGN